MSSTSKLFKTPAGLEGLEIYVQTHRDRTPPPYFAGRKDILKDIESTCTAIWQLHENRGFQRLAPTRLIYGAPGAGKSSTLAHLQDEWLAGRHVTTLADGSARSAPVPVMLNSKDGHIFNRLDSFCKELVDLVAPGEGQGIFNKVINTLRKSGSAHLSLVKGQIEQERTTEQEIVDANLYELSKLLPAEKWTRPVVIGVDEAQNLTGDRHSQVGLMLQALHVNNYNLPIMVVLAGLSDSKQRVIELGLSRLSLDSEYSLGCLDTEETEELKQGFCRHFEIDLGPRVKEFETLLLRTDGWPAHIQNCLLAFGTHYLYRKCDVKAIDFNQVDQFAQDARMNYYFARLSKKMKDSFRFLAIVMEQLKGEESTGEVISIIGRTAKRFDGDDDSTMRLPDNVTPREYYEDLIHRGALQEREMDRVSCPIPSFRQFLIHRGKKEKLTSNAADSESRHYRAIPEPLTEEYKRSFDEDFLRHVHLQAAG